MSVAEIIVSPPYEASGRGPDGVKIPSVKKKKVRIAVAIAVIVGVVVMK